MSAIDLLLDVLRMAAVDVLSAVHAWLTQRIDRECAKYGDVVGIHIMLQGRDMRNGEYRSFYQGSGFVQYRTPAMLDIAKNSLRCTFFGRDMMISDCHREFALDRLEARIEGRGMSVSGPRVCTDMDADKKKRILESPAESWEENPRENDGLRM